MMEGGHFRLSSSAHDWWPADPPAAPTPHGTAAHPCTQAQQYRRLRKIIMSNESSVQRTNNGGDIQIMLCREWSI